MPLSSSSVDRRIPEALSTSRGKPAGVLAVVLVVSAIGGLIARVMMGPEEMALLRDAREMRANMGDLKRRIEV